MNTNREDYLKIIFKLNECELKTTNKMIASSLNVAPASVSEMLKKLTSQGLVVLDNNSVTLSEKGISITKDILSKHRLWETFLLKSLNYNWQDVHEQAELLEHCTSEKLKESLNKFLSYPTHCPHGAIIYENYDAIDNNYIKMSKLKSGDKAIIKKVSDDKELLNYLDRINLKLDDSFIVLKKDGFDDSLIIKKDDEDINISYKALDLILVKIEK